MAQEDELKRMILDQGVPTPRTIHQQGELLVGNLARSKTSESVAITTGRTPPSICQGHGDRHITLVLNGQYQIASAPGKKFNQAAAGVQVTVAL